MASSNPFSLVKGSSEGTFEHQNVTETQLLDAQAPAKPEPRQPKRAGRIDVGWLRALQGKTEEDANQDKTSKSTKSEKSKKVPKRAPSVKRKRGGLFWSVVTLVGLLVFGVVGLGLYALYESKRDKTPATPVATVPYQPPVSAPPPVRQEGMRVKLSLTDTENKVRAKARAKWTETPIVEVVERFPPQYTDPTFCALGQRYKIPLRVTIEGRAHAVFGCVSLLGADYITFSDPKPLY